MKVEACRVKGCDRPKWARELCNTHYNRLRRTGSTDGPETKPLDWLRGTLSIHQDECIVWPYRDTDHYWEVAVDGRTRRATHVVLEWLGKPKPFEKAQVLHSCDNKPCVNHQHIRWGTQSENLKESFDRGLRDRTPPWVKDPSKSKWAKHDPAQRVI